MKKRKRSQESYPRQTKKIKYYAVAKGRTPGTVYNSWEECQKQVKGFKGAVFQSFASQGEAEAFLQSHSASSELRVVPSIRATAASLPSTSVFPQRPMESAFTPVAVSTVVIQAGSSITISATAPTSITIQVMGQPTDANPTRTTSITNVSPVNALPSVPVVQAPPRLLDVEPEHASVSHARMPLQEAVTPPESTHPVLCCKTVQIWFDGGARGNPGVQAGAGAVVVIQPEDLTYHVRLFLNGTRSHQDFRSYTNNQAEYSGVIVALQVVLYYLRQQPLSTRLDFLDIRGDSQLILKQLDGTYRCKSPALQSYFAQAGGLLHHDIQNFMAPSEMYGSSIDLHPNIRLLHVPRVQNQSADGTLDDCACRVCALGAGSIPQFSPFYSAALANEAMDQQQSWMTCSDDGHQQRYRLPES
jgi:ribonuclease HI